MMSIYVTNLDGLKYKTRFELQFANMLFRSGGRPAYNFTRWRWRKNCVDWNEKCICVVQPCWQWLCGKCTRRLSGKQQFLSGYKSAVSATLRLHGCVYMIDDFVKSKHCTLVLPFLYTLW